MGTVKSGWLEKQGQSILWKGWKKRHCVLYRDGEFSCYENVTDATAELRINLRVDVKRIESGFEVGSTNLPKHRSDAESLFAVITKHKSYLFLAASPQDCSEWVGALKNAQNSSTVTGAKIPMAPVADMVPPPAYSPMQYSQPLRGNAPMGAQPMGGPPQPQYNTGGGMRPAQPMYGQPMYGQPMYGQPMYGQPYGQYPQTVYVSQPQQQQQQQQQKSGYGAGSLLLAGGGGLVGGYMLGSLMNESMHHHHHHHDDYGHVSGFSNDNNGGFDSGGFDSGGGFDGGGFDGGFDF